MSLIIFFVDVLLNSDGKHFAVFDELTSIKYQFVALKRQPKLFSECTWLLYS